ncbi:MAG: AP endonuclease [Armatimonadetes bacterium RBG_16_58_9]|nr:MAG: AP endonuclease [Armatimonadetes bacterium RBG_16_58_9]
MGKRLITLFTGQFADIPLEELAKKAAEWGFHGLELACWGDHVDVDRAASDKAYARSRHEILGRHGLKCRAISNHLAGQLVCDPNNDARSDAFAPDRYAGDPEAKRAWAIDSMKKSARAAANMGIDVVNAFSGSSIWHLIYSFPAVSADMIEAGFADFAEKWNPILDVFDECGVKFALEVHPTEIAFDIITARRALQAVGHRKTFGFNFDPSHLLWQMVDPVRFIKEFADRIYHVHMKDAALLLDGESGILASYLNFGTYGRGWDFRSLGRGDVNFEAIIRALDAIRYCGPLSVEWEDANMDRDFGVREACAFVRKLDFDKSDRVFDEAFGN